MPIDRVIKVRVYDYIDERMSDAVKYGIMRAYKHTDSPTKDSIEEKIHRSVMSSLCDILDFGEDD